ncbi:MAG: hypothetical protein A2514_15205 [Gammaproteobacteria bacterium RIFOXYD12_FULL_61_37]|nr:MAG: hypothetical protein A2514_15205 [Gammaproteobacteria bacterium RIFOXYD12_FULL_61_37]
MQSQRYWIKWQFQDAKGQVGIGHYQAHGWKSWHHHMTLVAKAMLFLLEGGFDNIRRIRPPPQATGFHRCSLLQTGTRRCHGCYWLNFQCKCEIVPLVKAMNVTK